MKAALKNNQKKDTKNTDKDRALTFSLFVYCMRTSPLPSTEIPSPVYTPLSLFTQKILSPNMNNPTPLLKSFLISPIKIGKQIVTKNDY